MIEAFKEMAFIIDATARSEIKMASLEPNRVLPIIILFTINKISKYDKLITLLRLKHMSAAKTTLFADYHKLVFDST